MVVSPELVEIANSPVVTFLDDVANVPIAAFLRGYVASGGQLDAAGRELARSYANWCLALVVVLPIAGVVAALIPGLQPVAVAFGIALPVVVALVPILQAIAAGDPVSGAALAGAGGALAGAGALPPLPRELATAAAVLDDAARQVGAVAPPASALPVLLAGETPRERNKRLTASGWFQARAREAERVRGVAKSAAIAIAKVKAKAEAKRRALVAQAKQRAKDAARARLQGAAIEADQVLDKSGRVVLRKDAGMSTAAKLGLGVVVVGVVGGGIYVATRKRGKGAA